MAWDSTRPVPWQRLSREWLVYAVVMIAVFLLFARDDVNAFSVLGLAASYPMYLGFGWLLAKLGYQRKTFRDLRAASRPAPSAPAPSRPSRPAPTRRTSTGPSQHRATKRKKRR